MRSVEQGSRRPPCNPHLPLPMAPLPIYPQSGRDRNSTLTGISGILVILTVHRHRSVQLIRNSRKCTRFIASHEYSIEMGLRKRSTNASCTPMCTCADLYFSVHERTKIGYSTRMRACFSMRHKKGWSHVTLVSHLHSLTPAGVTSFLPLCTGHFVHACD